MKKFENEYEYVIMDTSPNLTPVTKNSFFAARYLLIPTQLEYFSAYGVSAVVREIKRGVQMYMDGSRGKILGIVPMMTELSRHKNSNIQIQKFAKQQLERALLGTKLFPDIPRAKSFSDASKERIPFIRFIDNKYDSQINKSEKVAIKNLADLANEVIQRIDEDESQRSS